MYYYNLHFLFLSLSRNIKILLGILIFYSCSAPNENDTEPPTIVITNPADGITLHASIVLKADATDNEGVKKVEFLVDGEMIGEDTSQPFEINWNLSFWADGNIHTILAKAYDNSENTGQSEIISVTISENAMDFVVPVSPILETIRDANTANLTWNKLEGATEYEVVVSNDENLNNIIFSELTVDTNINTTPLEKGSYFWGIKAKNSQNLWIDFNNISSFSIDGPMAPELIFPIHESKNDSINTINFNWYRSQYGINYIFELATDISFQNLLQTTTLADTFVTLSNLEKNIYFWRVRSQNSFEIEGGWSTPNKFEIDGPPPPFQILPENMSSIDSLAPITFRWRSIKSAVEYNLEISVEQDFTNILHSIVLEDTVRTFQIFNNGGFYWRIKSKNGSGLWGNWSTVFTFRVGQKIGQETGNIIAYYPFNGNSNDESGNGYHGSVNGATLTLDRDGNSNNAYSFNGSSNYINISHPVFNPNVLFQNSFSIEAWIKLNSISGTQTIISFGYDTGDPMLFEIHEGRMRIHMQLVGGDYNPANTTLNINTWYHVKLVGILGQGVTLYINGFIDGTTNIWGSMNGTLSAIGAGYAGSPGRYFNGIIDEVIIKILE